ncbi:hypothetical protein HK098_002501 [Nowakowskiella sp. JEL0407]|nr:hypothetical protein HK098_002501 [Nowakowskiella sp. JEL0407]
MLDYILGRPSANWRRVQVLLTIFLALNFLKNSGSRPPARFLRRINNKLENYPPWKIILTTLISVYASRNILLILCLNAPEPLARVYTRSFFRATWLLTGLDAGFLTAMNIQPKWLRDLLSVVFSIFYIMFPDSAEETVRKFKAVATVKMMRVSWEKAKNPYLRLATIGDRMFVNINRKIQIPRPNPPSISSFTSTNLPPIDARLFFAGTVEEFHRSTRLILQYPGGGFVTMDPTCHEDYLSMWAKQTKIPIVSINYGKAPEYPYPWALEECFDAYRSIAESNGEVIGMEGWKKLDSGGNTVPKQPIKIILEGDSAGGNLAVGVIIRCLEARDMKIPAPSALMLLYPCLSFDMACWMPSRELNLIRAESTKSLRTLIDAKSKLYLDEPLAQSEAPRSIDILTDKVDRSRSWYKFWESKVPKPKQSIPSALSMTSRMSYFTDKLISPELLRAMALLYLGQSPSSPDFEEDYYLSPVVAPDEILARFPKTYLLCGEKDPFVDDTVVFAGRLRDAKKKAYEEWERVKLRISESKTPTVNSTPTADFKHFEKSNMESRKSHQRKESFDVDEESSESDRSVNDASENADMLKSPLPSGIDEDAFQHHLFAHEPDNMVRVKILEGMSHAILQMTGLMPEARQATRLTGSWFLDMFYDIEAQHRRQKKAVAPDEDEALTEYMINEINELESVYIPSRGSSASLKKTCSNLNNHGLTPLTTAYHIGGYYPIHGAIAQDHSRSIVTSPSTATSFVPFNVNKRRFDTKTGGWQKVERTSSLKNRDKKRLGEVQETVLMERRRDELASNAGL